MTTRSLDGWGWLLAVIGAGSAANALWMLVGPMHWYTDLPAAVPDTGPFNPHFVRDIGCAFATVGTSAVVTNVTAKRNATVANGRIDRFEARRTMNSLVKEGGRQLAGEVVGRPLHNGVSCGRVSRPVPISKDERMGQKVSAGGEK